MQFARRPWGWWIALYSAKRFKLKLLYFKRTGQLSMQRHKKRHELWLFLFGSGEFYMETPPEKGSAVLVRRHKWHQYTAHERTLVLEVQFGESCNESDIERL